MKNQVLRLLLFLSLAINLGVIATIAWTRYEAAAGGSTGVTSPSGSLREHLDLTDEQVRAFEELHRDLETRVAAGRERVHERRQALFETLGGPSPDPAAIDAILGDISGVQAGIQRAVAESLLAQARLLSPDQRGRFVELLRDRARGSTPPRHLPLLGPGGAPRSDEGQ
ncbi:MAG: periplasmic heavy metal sensor [Acidobacteria bacterium]|nr:periplasmic heavy metal sensor [Acidobacteriota bacterium]